MKHQTGHGDLHLFDAPPTNGDAPTAQQSAHSGEKETAPAAEERKTQEARQAKFLELMENEYKDQFTAYFNEVFNRRFRAHKEMQEELEQTRAVVRAAAERFGIHDDSAALVAAIRADNSPSVPTAAEPQEETAHHETPTVESPAVNKDAAKADAANAMPISVGEQAPANSHPAMAQGETQGGEVSADTGRVSEEAVAERVRQAVAQAVERTRAETARQLMAGIRARGMRPAENAMHGGSVPHPSRDVAHMTRAERAEVARRVAGGETVKL